jgi:phosphoglycolate phosphatase-like HAD superfamily hydrolase
MAMTFEEVWNMQAKQQDELGLSTSELNEPRFHAEMNALFVLLGEEAGDLARVVGTHKHHLLEARRFQRHDIPEAVADVLKTVLAISIMAGLSCEEVVQAIREKTAAISMKAQARSSFLSERSKVACFDLDDVVFDLSRLYERLGVGVDTTEPNDPKAARLVEALKNEFYASDGFRHIEPIEGAVETLQELRERGWKLVYVTARPQWQYKRLLLDTLHSLKKHNIPHDLLLFSRNKVEAICEHLAPAWPRFFVEDHERNALELARAGVNVLLFDTPWNQNVKTCAHGSGSIARVMNWKNIQDVVRIYDFQSIAPAVVEIPHRGNDGVILDSESVARQLDKHYSREVRDKGESK